MIEIIIFIFLYFPRMFVSIALKKPGGTSYGFMDINEHSNWNHLPDINDWLSTIFSRRNFNNVVAYNDEEPGDEKDEKDEKNHSSHSNGGHAKGVVGWNEKSIGWLIHSVPKFPFLTPSNMYPLPRIDDGQLIYGQSFVYLELNYSPETLATILRQLEIMKAHIYFSTDSKNEKNEKNEKKERKKEVEMNVVHLSSDISHVSKSVKWGKDLFQDFLADFCHSPILCETWMKPGIPSSPTAKNVWTVRWRDEEQTEYTTNLDHSKYAVSMNSEQPWVFIGDINRMESQSRRGGGGVIIRNREVWNAFHSILFSYTDVVDNPHCKKVEEGCGGCLSFFKCFR